MAVAFCNRCRRLISISVIPGGNPEALADPERWSRSYRSCPVCNECYCDRCMDLEPLCPTCQGPRKRPGRDYWLIRIPWLCRHHEQMTDGEMMEILWKFTPDEPSVAAHVADIRGAFSGETLRTISAIAARAMSSLDPEDKSAGVVWRESPWEPGCPRIIPVEFFALLADCSDSD